jgi:hypothetical protein
MVIAKVNLRAAGLDKILGKEDPAPVSLTVQVLVLGLGERCLV